MIKKIGVLTGGGDCPGLNAVLRAVVKTATTTFGYEVIGYKDGYRGLVLNEFINLRLEDVSGILDKGGTILGTSNRDNPFKFVVEKDGKITTADMSDRVISNMSIFGVQCLVVIGGDGSLFYATELAKKGVRIIQIPKTIDNDLGATETSVGFDTAVAVATEALDRLQPTAASHDRVMVLEVMGRDAGHIALSAGIAGGADVILLPEVPYKIEHIARKIQQLKDSGRNFALVVVSEAVKTPEGEKLEVMYEGGEARYGGIGHYLCKRIADMTGSEARVTVLGHVQRGCPPTYNDRLLASAFGVRAVDLIREGKFNRMVAWQNRQIVDVAIEDAIKAYQQVDLNGTLVHTARALGISLGDE